MSEPACKYCGRSHLMGPECPDKKAWRDGYRAALYHAIEEAADYRRTRFVQAGEDHSDRWFRRGEVTAAQCIEDRIANLKINGGL